MDLRSRWRFMVFSDPSNFDPQMLCTDFREKKLERDCYLPALAAVVWEANKLTSYLACLNFHTAILFFFFSFFPKMSFNWIVIWLGNIPGSFCLICAQHLLIPILKADSPIFFVASFLLIFFYQSFLLLYTNP